MADNDDTKRMTASGLRRRTFDDAYVNAMANVVARSSRCRREVRRHLAEVAAEWRADVEPDAARRELAHGIGVAVVIVSAAIVIAVMVVALGLAS